MAEQSKQFQAERLLAANERTRIENEAKERAMKVRKKERKKERRNKPQQGCKCNCR